jgi:glycosyltransferase involved in cell wall biosynthesis
VITPTYNQRYELLARCIQSIVDQTYSGQLEHVIVNDGPDRHLKEIVQQIYTRHKVGTRVLRRVTDLGFWTTSEIGDLGVGPMSVGTLMATGTYHTWLADDDWFLPDHIKKLYNLLIDHPEASFSYPIVEVRYGEGKQEVGQSVPSCGNIAIVLYRRECLAYGMWRFGMGNPSDWDVIHQWITKGLQYQFLPEVTMVHNADH